MKTLIAFTKLPRLVTAAIFGALAFGCGAVSIAGDNDDAPRAVVKFGDLDLSNPQGAAALYSRIHAAAYDVCSSFDTDIRDQTNLTTWIACVDKTFRNALIKVNRPELSAIYNAHHRHPLPIVVAAAQSR